MSEIIYDETKKVAVAPFFEAAPIPVGKIPHDATQVSTYGNAINATTTIYTVTTGKTLYCSVAVYSVQNESGSAGNSYILVSNASDVIQYIFVRRRVPAGDGSSEALSFCPPLEIPAGYKLKAYSQIADLRTTFYVHGYEI